MKDKLFRYCLLILHKLAKFRQIGNLKQVAPSLVFEQPDAKRVGTQIDEFGNVDVWNIYNSTCSSNWGGAVIDENNFVYDKFVSFPWGKQYHPSITLPYLGRKTETLEKAIFLVTPEAKGNYYHWVVDLLPRLLLIKKLEINDFKERTIVLHAPSKRYENDTLSLLKIQPEKTVRLKPFEIIHVKNLLITDYVNYGEAFPIWKKELLQELKNSIILSVDRKLKNIYLKRGDQKKRRLIGEERLITILEKNDFEVVDPQKLSFVQQIETLSMAQVVIGLHGAALTNIVFCKERTLIIEIRSTIRPPEFFSEIAKTCNLQFETISISPERESSRANIDNKQNLILTDDRINDLLMKITTSAKKGF